MPATGLCPAWCAHRDQHYNTAPVCLSAPRPVVLSDPNQAETGPVVYGVRVLGAERAVIAVDRGHGPAFELTISEAKRFARALRAAIEDVTV